MAELSHVWQACCPECGASLRFRRPLVLGAYVICPTCDGELEVIGLTPLEFSLAFDDSAFSGGSRLPAKGRAEEAETNDEAQAKEP